MQNPGPQQAAALSQTKQSQMNVILCTILSTN